MNRLDSYVQVQKTPASLSGGQTVGDLYSIMMGRRGGSKSSGGYHGNTEAAYEKDNGPKPKPYGGNPRTGGMYIPTSKRRRQA